MVVNRVDASPEDGITVRELLDRIWAIRWLALGVMLACVVGAGIASIVVPKTYEASVVVSPVSSSPEGGQLGALGSLAAQFGGIASLAGVQLGADARKSETLAVLQSEALTEQYIKDNDLLKVLYADKWDALTKRWKVTDPKKIPTLWKANRDFRKKIRSLASDTKTGLATLTISWRDANTSAKWANDLVRLTNDYLRSKAIQTSERNIAYLDEQAKKTDVLEIRQAIYTILQSEINKAMIARGTDEYALKIIDPAVAPEEPSTPHPVLWILLAVFVGLVLSVGIAFVQTAWIKGR